MRRIALLVVACALSVPMAEGQTTRVYLNSGVAFPTGPGDVGEFWDRGPTFDLAVGRRFGDRLEMTIGGGRATFPIAENKLLAIGADLELSGGDFTVTSFVGTVRIELERGSWFRPYLNVGLGLHRVAITDLSIRVLNPEDVCPGQTSCVLTFEPGEAPTETAFGLRLGAGIAYYLRDTLWLYAEPTYHLIMTDERVGMVPLRVGIARAF